MNKNKKTYSGPAWFPEERIINEQKQNEAAASEMLFKATLESLSEKQVDELVKAVNKTSLKVDPFYTRKGIFI